jgi:TonB-linked SusC/RagA family outer membrane protein
MKKSFIKRFYSYFFISKKILRTMKLSTLLFFITTFSMIASNSFSQVMKVDVYIENATIKEVLLEIRKQVNVSFLYNNEELNDNKRVTLNVHDSSVEDVLDFLLKDQNLAYSVENNVILIYRLETKLPVTGKQQIDRKRITGIVTDEHGDTIIGANVLEKDAANGVVTDVDGNFSLFVSENAILDVSYIGYVTQSIVVGDQTSISVTLMEDTKALDEIVIVGYGQQRRSEITTSITKVSSENFIKGSVKSADQLIQGKVSGLQVVNPSGDPTAEVQMMLRGVSTLSASTAPLVVIDGIPGGVLNSIAPDDIESIDVLKDGSAAAIYGTRGTNGVVIVTTKRSDKSGRLTLDYNGYMSINTIKKQVEVLSASEYKNLKNDPQFIANEVNILDYGADVNYVDEVLRTPVSQSHNLSMRGGNVASNYSASITYRDNQGIILNSNRDQLNAKLSLNHAMLNNRLQISLNVNNAVGKDDVVGERGIYIGSIQRNPTIPIYRKDGSYMDEYGMTDNPIARLTEETRKREWNRLLTSGKITIIPIENLNLSVMGALQRYDSEYNASRTKKHPVYVQNGTLPNATLSNELSMDKTLEIVGDYVKTLANHKFSIMAGYSYQDFDNKWSQMYADNLPTDLFGPWNIATAASIKDGKATLGSNRYGSKLIAFFGRATYNYMEKYFLMGSLRYEGSSKFGKDNKWGVFPAVSAGWEITGEDFMKEIELISNLKLRAGFGVTGTMPQDPYLSLTKLDYGQIILSNGQWIESVIPTSNPNPDLKWETKNEYNIGIDYGFLKNRISGAIDVYIRKTSDLLFNYPVPVPPNLVSNTWANVGEITNQGIEFSVNYDVIRNSDLRWGIGGNFSYNKNKVNSLSNSLYQRDWVQVGDTEEPMKTYTHRLEEGQPVGNFYSWRYAGLTPEGKWLFYDRNGEAVTADKVSEEDKAITGNGIPKINAGLTTSLYYKNFDLTIMMRGSFLFDVLNRYDMRYTQAQHAKAGTNMTKKALEIPRNGQTYIWDSPVYSDYYIEKGDFLKIDNITLGYTIKLPWKEVRNLRVYTSGLNLFTITKYKGLDPEVSLTGSSVLDPGTAGSIVGRGEIYPTTRTFTVGVNLSF